MSRSAKLPPAPSSLEVRLRARLARSPHAPAGILVGLSVALAVAALFFGLGCGP